MVTVEIDEFVRRWKFVRSETVEIWDSLHEKDLWFRPEGEKWRPMLAHFACMTRTQMVYTQAVRQGAMDFKWFGTLELPQDDQFGDKDAGLGLLQEADEAWLKVIKVGRQVMITWPGGQISVANHIMRLAEHERLHHGQLIAYFNLAGIVLPPKFTNNWAL